jgi:hypothetical protein
MMDHPLTPSADAEVRALIQEHRKIYAIKLLREKTGLGLKEAKDTVDAMEREMGLPPASTMPESLGGLVLAAVVLITGFLAWWWLRG